MSDSSNNIGEIYIPPTPLNKSEYKVLEVLDMIIDDCEADVNEFDGKEFNGKTLGELHGILEAKIEALAKIVKLLIVENGKK